MRKQLIAFGLIAFIASLAAAMGTAPQVPPLAEMRGKVQRDLDKLDNEVKSAARKLSALGLRGDATRALLQSLYDNNSAVVTAATVSSGGTLVAIQPSTYRKSEGQNISDQEHFPQLKQTGRPVLSKMFKTVEGFQAVSLAYPIDLANGERLGYVSVVFKPDALVRNTLKQYSAGYVTVEATALQLDGRIIYDKDPLQIGNMTFSSSAYEAFPSLLALAERMTLEATGSGSYEYTTPLNNIPIGKSAAWTTIGLHGTDWRLMIAYAK
ncbi:MAG TPA: hypothetical protein VMT55_01620 [Candidatus Sulfotelmatobacter sp.]|nr:hypothetical protein [Candidatus Sulfotelmatobacter sp.]